MAKMYFVFFPAKLPDGRRGKIFIGHRTTEAGAKKLVQSNLHLLSSGMADCLWYSYDVGKYVTDSGYFGIKRTGAIDRSWRTFADDVFLPTARKVIRGTIEVKPGTIYEN